MKFPAALGLLDVGANWLVGGTGGLDDSGLAKVGSNTTQIQAKVSTVIAIPPSHAVKINECSALAVGISTIRMYSA